MLCIFTLFFSDRNETELRVLQNKEVKSAPPASLEEKLLLPFSSPAREAEKRGVRVFCQAASATENPAGPRSGAHLLLTHTLSISVHLGWRRRELAWKIPPHFKPQLSVTVWTQRPLSSSPVPSLPGAPPPHSGVYSGSGLCRGALTHIWHRS